MSYYEHEFTKEECRLPPNGLMGLTMSLDPSYIHETLKTSLLALILGELEQTKYYPLTGSRADVHMTDYKQEFGEDKVLLNIVNSLQKTKAFNLELRPQKGAPPAWPSELIVLPARLKDEDPGSIPYGWEALSAVISPDNGSRDKIRAYYSFADEDMLFLYTPYPNNTLIIITTATKVGNTITLDRGGTAWLDPNINCGTSDEDRSNSKLPIAPLVYDSKYLEVYNPIVMSACLYSSSVVGRNYMPQMLATSRYTPTTYVVRNIASAAEYLLKHKELGLTDKYNLTMCIVYYINTLDEHHTKEIQRYLELMNVTIDNLPGYPERCMHSSQASQHFTYEVAQLINALRALTQVFHFDKGANPITGVVGGSLKTFSNAIPLFPYLGTLSDYDSYKIGSIFLNLGNNKKISDSIIAHTFPMLGKIMFIDRPLIGFIQRDIPAGFLLAPIRAHLGAIKNIVTEGDLIDMYASSGNPYLEDEDTTSELKETFLADLTGQITGSRLNQEHRPAFSAIYYRGLDYVKNHSAIIARLATRAEKTGSYKKLKDLYREGRI